MIFILKVTEKNRAQPLQLAKGCISYPYTQLTLFYFTLKARLSIRRSGAWNFT